MRILDFPHAVEHLTAAAQPVLGNGTPAFIAWLDQQAHTLKHAADGARQMLAALARLPVQAAADPILAAAARDGALAYFTKRLVQVQYATFQVAGYPIGSGSTESANKVVVRYAETGGERHHVTTDVPAAPLVVVADAGRLEQILDNLLSNSVKYSPSGGEIGVSLQQAVDGIVLTVSDAGIVLTPGAQERIFEPFGRAANATRQGLPGMGLGLHICQQIAEAHGGRMWAESAGEGHGMTVGLWLPLP